MLDKTKYTRIGFFIGLSALYLSMTFIDNESKTLSSEMASLGMAIPDWLKPIYTSDEIELGRQLVEQGSLPGKKRVSAFFVCTDCHLNQREKATFNGSTAKENLNYLKQHDLDVLPATSFYGMINQTEYYSGDYIKKYGDLVLDARNSLEGAIQLCAQECSQGRKLTSEEVTYTLAYLKSKELMLSDLFERSNDFTNYQNLNLGDKKEFIKQNFKSKRQNNFGSTNLSEIKKLSGDSNNGKYIFQHSCMSCHKNERVSFYNIDESALSKKDLLKKLNNKENELMSIIRYGTQPLPGSKAYMPLFTNEKLSDQQVADLIAYINEN